MEQFLIQKIVDRDEDAFEQLVKEYRHSVLNTIYRYIGDSAEAQDIAQEVFIKVWQHAKNFRGESRFSTWLYRIVVNQCLNYRAKKRESLPILENTISSNSDVSFEDEEEKVAIKKAVNELPERQRIALILSKFEGKSYKEIAQIMKVSLSSVESLIFRARENLREKLLPLIKK
ncbi:MAG: sigma-70 family RNA polymerase sigma factor [bacterium]